MPNAIAAWLAGLTVVNSQAVASVLFLTICAVVFGLGWGYRDRMTRWWSTSVRAAGLLMGLVVVALQVSHHGWLVDVDRAVTTWLVGHRSPAADQMAVTVTNAFGPVQTACAAALVAVLAVVRFRSYLSGLTIIACVGGASLSCLAIKLLLARDRPPLGIQESPETDYSFPSGHVTGTLALFGMVVVVVGMHRSDAVTRWLACGAVVVVAAAGLSRLYLGVHCLTDVLAGVLLGSAAVEIGAMTLRGLIGRDDGAIFAHTVHPHRREVLL